MFRILVVEDDRNLNRSVCSYLTQKGYNATGCNDVNEAYHAMYSNVFDMIISDIMMPGIDGYEFAKTVRSTDKEIPIIFISARDDLLSKQRAFGAAVDDYMTKPIDLNELVLRIEAVMRRAKIATSRKLVVGSLTMDMDERTAKIDSREIQLTAREFNILYKLLSYPGKTFSRSQLMDEFWNMDTSSGPRTVDVYMAKIRDKFSCCDDFSIQTVHGLGYKAVVK